MDGKNGQAQKHIIKGSKLDMKKILAFITVISIILVSLSITACSDSVKKQAVAEGAIFGGQSDDKIGLEVSFDSEWITTAENTSYNPELAKFCALLSADSYFRQKDYDKGRQNRVLFAENTDKDYSMTDFLNVFGFTDAEHYESYLALENPIDSNDSVTLNIGHQVVAGQYDVYAVVIRGCFSWQEWCSAFDPGCTEAEYEKLTGSHPEWTHNEYHKGVDIAANRALTFIEDFMAKHNDEMLPDCILLTGHSRGGSIANVLGAYFEKEADIRSYTYTFNTMPAVRFAADSYETIFNVFDKNDFFTDPFPFKDGSFVRYGVDMVFPDVESDEFQVAVAALKGRDDYNSISSDAVAEYRGLFAERFPCCDMLCDTETITCVYDDEDGAAAGREEYCTLIGSENGLGLEDLCTVGEVVKCSDGRYTLTVEYNALAMLRSYAKILAYGSAAYDAFVDLFAGDETGCRIAALIVENAGGINGGHLLANSYVISGIAK